MKKILSVLLAVLIVTAFVGCGSDNDKEIKTANSEDKVTYENQGKDDVIDVDLTQLSSTMVYSEVYDMVNNSSKYIGKRIKMKGQFSVYQPTDENGKIISDKIYFLCLIADATACCQQGLEFILAGDYKYPEDYPELGTEITVVGEFKSYMEGPNEYYELVNAEFTD